VNLLNSKVTKIIAISLSLTLIVFLGSVAYSILPPRLSIVPPETFELSYDSENKTLYLSTNVSVSNTGFYSIDNLQIEIDIVNSTGYHIIQASTISVDVPAGFSGPLGIIIPLNITELLESFTYNYLFDSFPLNLTLTINADYAFQVFHLKASYQTQEEWIGPLANLSVKVVDTDVSFDKAIKMQSIIQVSHDGWLSLTDIPLNITARLSNGTELASGFSSFTITPGTRNNTLTVTVNPIYAFMLLTENASLVLQASINLYGFQFNYLKPYNWGAPLYNLTISTPEFNIINSTHSKIMTNLSATNYSPIAFGCNATMKITQNDIILGSSVTNFVFPIGIRTTIPLILDITNPTILSSLCITVELRTPLKDLFFEYWLSI
jgi:hypothetical protein